MTDRGLATEPTGRVVGVDGCAGGWVAVWTDGDGLGYGRYDSVADLCGAHGAADRLLVDIPIGLASSEPRACDRLARNCLGARGSSVFPAPCRAVVEYRQEAGEAASYDRATEINREHLGSGISRQSWNITGKIAAMDRALREESLAADIVESHPELCFAKLNRGYPIAHPKSSETGRAARFAVLDSVLDGWQSIYTDACAEYYRKEVARDDIVDALVLCAAGRQPLVSFPAEPPVDARGHPMGIVAPDIDPVWTDHLDLAKR